MILDLISYTNAPEETCVRCARNDYADFDLNVATASMQEVLANTKSKNETVDEKMYDLLKKMMLRGHYGVLEHASFTFRFVASRALMAQITRHRYISFDIQSQRYVNFTEAPFYFPSEHWPTVDGVATVKTRKGVKTIEVYPANKKLAASYSRAIADYNELVEDGWPEEDARMVLPNGIMCSITGTMNLRTALHIVSMRGAGDAQSEIRELAGHVEAALKEVAPIVYRIWTENRRAIEHQKLSP